MTQPESPEHNQSNRTPEGSTDERHPHPTRDSMSAVLIGLLVLLGFLLGILVALLVAVRAGWPHNLHRLQLEHDKEPASQRRG